MTPKAIRSGLSLFQWMIACTTDEVIMSNGTSLGLESHQVVVNGHSLFKCMEVIAESTGREMRRPGAFATR